MADDKEKKVLTEWVWSNDLTEKERTFVKEYILSGDTIHSAKKAEYVMVETMATKLIQKQEILAEIELIREEIVRKKGSLSQEEVVKEFKLIAEANILDFYDEMGNVKDIDEMDKEKARCVKEIVRTVNPKTGAVTVKVTMHDKISALQNLGRIGGYYAADNGQSQGNVNIMLNVPGGVMDL